MIRGARLFVVHTATAALACVCLFLTALQLSISPTLHAMENLGAEGPTRSWVVVAPPSELAAGDLTERLLSAAGQHRLSLAYSPDAESAILRVFDPDGLFGFDDDAYATLLPYSQTVLTSATLARNPDLATALLGLGLTKVGALPAGDRFRGSPPHAAASVEADALGSGYYLLTGPEDTDWDRAEADIWACWEEFGLDIVEYQATDPPGPFGFLLTPGTPYWFVGMAQILAPWLGCAVVSAMHARSREELSVIAAVVGASRHRILRDLSYRLGSAAILGTLLGTLVTATVARAAEYPLDPSAGMWLTGWWLTGLAGTLILAMLPCLAVTRRVAKHVVC